MDKNLIITGAVNSAIAMLFFLTNSVEYFSQKRKVFGSLFLLSAIFTVADVARFYHLL